MIFSFKIKTFNENTWNEELKKYINPYSYSYGFVDAENFTEAVTKIENYFQKDLEEICRLAFHDDSNGIVFAPKAAYEEIVASEFPYTEFEETIFDNPDSYEKN